MGVFSRFGDIVNANINAVLEKAEDPEKIIRLMIQEMEDTLVEIRSAAAKCIADRKELRRRAELALRREREDLARAALTEKQAIDDQIGKLTLEAEVLDSQLDKFTADISQLQGKLNDAKLRQRSIVIRHQTAQSQLSARRHIHSDRIDEMLFRFESAERRIDKVESEAEAVAMGRNRTLASEIADLETDDRVEAELNRLKSKVGEKPKENADE
jgi:phage shock protein A